MRGKERTPRHIVFGSEALLTGMNSRAIFKEQQKPTGASSGLFSFVLVMYLFWTVLGLCCHAPGALASRFLISVASLIAGHRL